MGKSIGLILALQDKCSPQLSKIAQNLGITEKEAKKLHNEVSKLSKNIGNGLKNASLALGAGLAGATATIGTLVNKSVEAGDRIDKMSQKIGMSRKAFQEWDYIMSQNGGSVDNLQMGFKSLVNQMNGVQKGSKESINAFRQLGVAVKDNNGKFRNQSDVFNDTVRALQKIQNPAQKAILANKLFGRSAVEMMPLLNQSASSIDALRKKANDLGLVMGDDAVEASVKLKDTIDTVQRTFSAFGNQIGAEFMPVVQQVADELINHMPQIKATLTPILHGLGNVVKFCIEHFTALSVIAGTVLTTIMAYQSITGVIAVIKTLHSAIKVVSLAQGVWNALMLANPIGLIAVGIGTLIGAVALLALNWEKVTAIVTKAINAVKTFIGLKPKVKVETEEVKTEKEPIKHNAVGSAFYSGGKTSINEFGGEVVDLPQGSRIYPKDKAPKTGDTHINISLNVQGNLLGNREFFDEMMNLMGMELEKVLV